MKPQFFKDTIKQVVQESFPLLIDDNLGVEEVVGSLKNLKNLKTKIDKTDREMKLFDALQQNNLFKQVDISLENIYSEIINPKDTYKNEK